MFGHTKSTMLAQRCSMYIRSSLNVQSLLHCESIPRNKDQSHTTGCSYLRPHGGGAGGSIGFSIRYQGELLGI